jgi:O-antigen/teichoic acid export membrane protein
MALMLPVSRNAVPVFQAAGRPQYNLYAGLLLAAVMVPLVFLLAPYGIVGVAAAVVTAHTAGALTNVYLLTRILPDTIRPTAGMSALYLLLGGAMVLAVTLAKPVVGRTFGGTANIPSLIILVLVGAVVYCGLALLTQRELVLELVDLLRTVLRRGDRTSASVVKEVAG